MHMEEKVLHCFNSQDYAPGLRVEIVLCVEEERVKVAFEEMRETKPKQRGFKSYLLICILELQGREELYQGEKCSLPSLNQALVCT